MKVLIAGAGYVGGALAKELASDGHEVFALRRTLEPQGAGVMSVAADLTDPTSLERLPSGIDRLVYCAAPSASGPAGKSEAEYQRAYVDGLRNVLDAIEERGTLLRAIFTSSTAVYAQNDGSVVDELSEATATGNARSLLEGEALISELGDRGTVLRLAGIYGPGRDRVVRMVKEGTARLGSGVYGNRIHQADCVGVIRHLLGLKQTAPIYVGVDQAPVLLDEVYTWVASELRLPPPPYGEPDARAQGGGTKRASSALLRKSGYRFRFPTFREGYREAIDARV